jgi:NAD(P)-dependent dehydrogenase (short-subunit alcohol dehydrogenase family)
MERQSRMSYDFSGKVALVTGASGGIGRATALAFGRAGAAVVVSDVNAAGGEETVGLIEAAGGRALFQACDVADAGAVKTLVQRTIEAFGRLDYGHNNAGINNMGADEWDDAVWNRSVAINLDGVMHCMREEAAAMLANGGGAIVNTASINGFTGNGRQPAYVATKHGVIGLTRHGALKWARDNIRVNAVCPGVIETPMTDAVARSPEMRKAMEALTPMGRMGRPEEIASAVLWLCSDQASFVTGHPLVIDGGATVS